MSDFNEILMQYQREVDRAIIEEYMRQRPLFEMLAKEQKGKMAP
jgi:hypothetical protein